MVLQVNQNMRYDHSVRALKTLLNRGMLGEPVLATIELRAIPHWMPWAEGSRSLSTFIMSIHHLDTFRYWLGDPVRVLASTRPDPRTKFPHADGINLYVLEYAGGRGRRDGTTSGPARARRVGLGDDGPLAVRGDRGDGGWRDRLAGMAKTSTQHDRLYLDSRPWFLATASLDGVLVPGRFRRHDGRAAASPWKLAGNRTSPAGTTSTRLLFVKPFWPVRATTVSCRWTISTG